MHHYPAHGVLIFFFPSGGSTITAQGINLNSVCFPQMVITVPKLGMNFSVVSQSQRKRSVIFSSCGEWQRIFIQNTLIFALHFSILLHVLFPVHKKTQQKLEIKLVVEQQFSRNSFQRNKAFTVSNNKTLILQFNNAKPVTKYRTMQYRWLRFAWQLQVLLW